MLKIYKKSNQIWKIRQIKVQNYGTTMCQKFILNSQIYLSIFKLRNTCQTKGNKTLSPMF